MPGQFTSANVDIAVYEAALNIGRNQKVEINAPTVESLLNDIPDKVAAKLIASLIVTNVRKKVGPILTVYPVEYGVRAYQYGKYEPEAKQTLTSFASPIIHSSYAPAATLGNEERGIKSRILVPQQKTKDLELTPFLTLCIDDYSKALFPVPHILHPTDDDVLFTNQATPSQKSILQQAMALVPGYATIVKSFVKRESYGTPNDPRIISTLEPRTKADYSRYIYSLSPTFYAHRWYAFGKCPRDVAYRVSEVCRNASSVAVTDYTKFDGHVNIIARDLERTVLLRAFHQTHHDDLLYTWSNTLNRPAVGRFGTFYDTCNVRNSGSSDTAVANTMLNHFLAYVAFRCTKHPDGTFFTHDEAWEATDAGLFAGDDGLVPDPPQGLAKAVEMCGFSLKVEIVERGNYGVSFISRLYGPNVWTGEPDSTCDLYRQLAKFHTSPNLPDTVTPEQKLVEKAFSFSLTDANTPVIGQYCKLVLDAAAREGKAAKGIKTLARWGDEHEISHQWPNHVDDFSDHLFQSEPLSHFSRDTWNTWVLSLGDCPTLKELLAPPLCLEPERKLPKTTAVVEDELITLIDGLEVYGPAPAPLPTPHVRPKRNECVRAPKSATPSVKSVVGATKEPLANANLPAPTTKKDTTTTSETKPTPPPETVSVLEPTTQPRKKAPVSTSQKPHHLPPAMVEECTLVGQKKEANAPARPKIALVAKSHVNPVPDVFEQAAQTSTKITSPPSSPKPATAPPATVPAEPTPKPHGRRGAPRKGRGGGQ